MKLGLTPVAFAFAVSACAGRAPTDSIASTQSSNASPADQDGSQPPAPNAAHDPRKGSALATSGRAQTRVGASSDSSDADVTSGADGGTLDALYASLPLTGAAGSPTISSISVRCAASRADLDADPSDATYPAAFARVLGVTDPQGVGNLAFTVQELVLYADEAGHAAESHTFTVSLYGTTFGGFELGTYFANDPNVLASMCARSWWPGEVTVSDASGHVTHGKVRVAIVR